jgi:hypothetical protein
MKRHFFCGSVDLERGGVSGDLFDDIKNTKYSCFSAADKIEAAYFSQKPNFAAGCFLTFIRVLSIFKNEKVGRTQVFIQKALSNIMYYNLIISFQKILESIHHAVF